MTESYWFDLTVVFGMEHLLSVVLFSPPLLLLRLYFWAALLFAASRLWCVGSRQLGRTQGQMINMSGLKIFPKWHRNANWFWNKNILVTFRLGYCKIHITWGYHLGEKNEKGNVKTKGNPDLHGSWSIQTSDSFWLQRSSREARNITVFLFRKTGLHFQKIKVDPAWDSICKSKINRLSSNLPTVYKRSLQTLKVMECSWVRVALC